MIFFKPVQATIGHSVLVAIAAYNELVNDGTKGVFKKDISNLSISDALEIAAVEDHQHRIVSCLHNLIYKINCETVISRVISKPRTVINTKTSCCAEVKFSLAIRLILCTRFPTRPS